MYFSANRRTFKAIFMKKTLKMTKKCQLNDVIMTSRQRLRIFSIPFLESSFNLLQDWLLKFFLSDDLQGENLRKKKK